MKEDTLISEVKRKLGYPAINLELSLEQYKDAIKDSLRFYSRIKPKIVNRDTNNILRGGVDSSYIQLNHEEMKDLIDVVACDYKNILEQRFNYSGLIDTPVVPYSWQSDASRYTLEMQKIKMNASAIGYDGDWTYDENMGRIFLAPVVKGGETVRYVLTKIRSISDIPVVDEDLFKKLAEAFCRDVLADIRGKYSGIPSPGGDLTLDADRQQAKADALKAEVKTDLMSQSFPTPWTHG